jgi:tRNA-dihydrouridine synthase
MTNFWNNLPKPFFALAPMEAVTDVVWRHVIASAAKPDIFFTEFVNASSFCSPKGTHSTRGRLAFTSDEQPIVAQIWGNKPDEFTKMSLALAEMGYAGIDINMGCPDKSVIKTGSGSALIRTPELAGELIRAAKTGGLPVSVKTRLGDIKANEWQDWIGFLLRQDIVNLTVHLRTRSEMSKVKAHFELIPDIKKLRDEIAPDTLLTINGDIRDRKHGMELVDTYGIDGIMIGRGVFSNPFAFEKSDLQLTSMVDVMDNKHLQPERDKTPGLLFSPGAKPFIGDNVGHTRQDLLNLLNLHLDLHDKYSNELEPRKFDPLKRFFKIYIRDFPGASELRETLMHTKNTDEARRLLK